MQKIVAITGCPVGIAHTYMAAEALEKIGKSMGIIVIVETHGSIGIENELTSKDIADAIGVIIAADIDVDLQRFYEKPLLQVSVKKAMKEPDKLIKKILDEKAPIYKAPTTLTFSKTRRETEKNLGNMFYKSLMNGVSHMVPFVVTGGLLIAIALSLGGKATPTGIVVADGTFWKTILTIGEIGMGLMIPIMSAYIAYGIAERPGLVPGFIGGMLAANGTLYGSQANAGFLGGIIAGFLAGYVVYTLKKINVPKALQSIMPIIILPIAGSLIVGFSFIYILGEPISWLFAGLTSWLASMQGGSKIVLALILGGMISFDMGGPLNKVAFLFGSGLIAEGNFEIMGPIAVAICIPPLSVGVASFVLPEKFSQAEKESGKAAFIMGLFGITEGAIPFATQDPLRVIPSIMFGSMIGAVSAMLFGVTDHVAHGGPIVALLGAVDNVLFFVISVLFGIASAVAMLCILKKDINTKKKKTKLINESHILLETETKNKEEIIDVLIKNLYEGNKIKNIDVFRESILKREKEGSTAIGYSVAIPHGKSKSVEEPAIAFMQCQEPIDWDGQKTKLIFMIAVPVHESGNTHLKILQILSRNLMNDIFRQKLLKATSKAEIYETLKGIE